MDCFGEPGDAVEDWLFELDDCELYEAIGRLSAAASRRDDEDLPDDLLARLGVNLAIRHGIAPPGDPAERPTLINAYLAGVRCSPRAATDECWKSLSMASAPVVRTGRSSRL